MPKKIIISESMFNKVIAKQLVNEELNKSEVISIIKDSLKNDNTLKKDIDKRVRELVAASVNTLFKTLWQRRNFYEDEIKRG